MRMPAQSIERRFSTSKKKMANEAGEPEQQLQEAGPGQYGSGQGSDRRSRVPSAADSVTTDLAEDSVVPPKSPVVEGTSSGI